MKPLPLLAWSLLFLPVVGCGSGDGDGDADGGGDGGEAGDTDVFGAADAHNAVRRNVQPAADPPLPDLVWDADLARIAREWAEGCVFEHSNNGLGENLYAATGAPTIDDAVTAWAAEAADYDYATNSCSDVCGHYTQIVWRTTSFVGCGFADCPTLEGAGFGGRYWVCNYDPPGNIVGRSPY